MTAEQWRPVAGFPNYLVSDQGRVASEACGKRRILKPWLNANGYLYVNVGGRAGQKRTVHGLVAEAFCGPRMPGQVVRHLDGQQRHNAASNLAIGSPSENSYDAVRHGTHGMVNRTHCPRNHEYTAENTHLYQGRRFCKACKEDRRFEDRRRRGLLLIVGRDPYKPCPQNHGWTPENTYISPQGVRYCRPCARVRSRQFAERKMLRAAGITSERAA